MSRDTFLSFPFLSSLREPLPIGNDPLDLEVTLPGEGKDRVFRVTIKWTAQVSLYALEEALEGKTRQIPFDAIQVKYSFRLIYLSSFPNIFFN